jgi:cyclopropane fatty-acyl-phospholipid synthase-like methyltransferase
VTQPPDWDTVYVADAPPPWDIGRPQPAFLRLAESGVLSGHLLDAGCGTGEHTLMAAAHGADAVGVDVSPAAIARARAKAAERGLSAHFEVGDALDLGQLGMTFDTVIDSGLFHVFDDEGRGHYMASLASVLRSGGTCYLMCFSDLQEGTIGPRRVRKDEIVSAFSDGWTVTDIAADEFVVNAGPVTGGRSAARAWLATIRRQ